MSPGNCGVFQLMIRVTFHCSTASVCGSFSRHSQVLPIVNFNGDGIVDAADMCIMVDHWGTDYSLCDIGPMSWGDGIVDVEDLEVLAEHLFEEVPLPSELIAYWKLDEEEDDIAYDSAGENAGLLFGGPVWQPVGGKINGVLELDRIGSRMSSSTLILPNISDASDPMTGCSDHSEWFHVTGLLRRAFSPASHNFGRSNVGAAIVRSTDSTSHLPPHGFAASTFSVSTTAISSIFVSFLPARSMPCSRRTVSKTCRRGSPLDFTMIRLAALS